MNFDEGLRWFAFQYWVVLVCSSVLDVALFDMPARMWVWQRNESPNRSNYLLHFTDVLNRTDGSCFCTFQVQEGLDFGT